MDETTETIINSIVMQENQILAMRRELNGIHASITNVEQRVDSSRLVMIMVGFLFVVVALWLWLFK